MTIASHHHASRREILSELFDRLKRVQAASGTVKSLVTSPDTTTATLTDALRALERDLLLAERDSEAARERLMR
jgi:hypothetical protein